jgi:hypothetical protein
LQKLAKIKQQQQQQQQQQKGKEMTLLDLIFFGRVMIALLQLLFNYKQMSIFQNQKNRLK